MAENSIKKVSKFRKKLADLILAGEKTTTWRLFDDKDLKVGDLIELVVWENGEKFAEAKITDVWEKKLRELKPEDYDGHEKFKDQEEMLNTYKKYYGEKVNFDTIVKIIKFKLL